MEEIFINPDNLTKEQIDKTAVRAKALIINDREEIVLGFSLGTYQFPGGHLSNGEDACGCLKREVLEETGIEIKEDNLKPFASITNYVKNYRDSGLNRENVIYYYLIRTNDEPDLSRMDHDELEQLGNFQVVKVPLNEINELLIKSIPYNTINEIIVDEMLKIIDIYRSKKEVL